MGLLVRSLESRAAVSTSLHPGDPALVSLLGGRPSASGVVVTPETALTMGAVFAAVRLKAQTVAALPLHVFRRVARGKVRDRAHPLYPVLHEKANPETTSYEWRSTMQGHLELRGNAYSEIEFTGGGDVKALWPLRPDRVALERRGSDNQLVYRVTVPQAPDQILPASRVLHVRGLGSNGLQGYSVVQLAAQAIGLGLAQEEFGGRFFAGDGSPSGVLQNQATISDDAYERMRSDWQNAHQGLSNAHRIAILEEGTTWQSVGMSNNDSQFLESRTFSVVEIARWFNVPPHKIAELSKATFSNIENQELAYVVDSVQPDLVNWEQRLSDSLLMESERRTHFVEHDVKGRLRGDMTARGAFYRELWSLGAMSPNDIRELENENPRADEAGDAYYTPLNFVASDGSAADPEPAPPEPRSGEVEKRAAQRRSAEGRRRLAVSSQPLFEDVARRILRAESREVSKIVAKLLPDDERAATRGHSELLAALATLYGPNGDLRKLILRTAGPAWSTFGALAHDASAAEIGIPGDPEGLERLIASLVGAFAVGHSVTSEARLRRAIEGATPGGEAAAVDKLLGDWKTNRAGAIARRESVSLVNPVHKLVAKRAGHRRQVWHAFGENCPFCSQLDGRVIGIEDAFIGAGETLNANDDGQTAPLTPQRAILDAPAHSGCDCTVTTE